MLAAPHVSLTISACAVCSELHLKLADQIKEQMCCSWVFQNCQLWEAQIQTQVCVCVCVYPEERGCGGLPLNGSQVQHSPFSPPEPGFLWGFACKEGICREVTKLAEHRLISLLERHQGRVCVSQRQCRGETRKAFLGNAALTSHYIRNWHIYQKFTKLKCVDMWKHDYFLILIILRKYDAQWHEIISLFLSVFDINACPHK